MTHSPAKRPWIEPLYTSDQMRALDAWAIEQKGTQSLDLMERAGSEVARAVAELAPGGLVRIVCGKGNNGGDGLVVARLLREQGFDVEALLLWPPEELSTDARANHERLDDGGRVVEAAELPAALEGSAAIVDALLGTGFAGDPRDPVRAAIDAINATGAPVVAIDVPSGLDASSGEITGACVDARLTVTLQKPKVGLWVHPGKHNAGRVEVVDIGLPVNEPDAPPVPPVGLIRSPVLELPEPRGPAGNKFDSGAVLVIGGSTGLTGAVCLCCEAAMRAGGGWVRAAVPASLNEIFEIKLTEVMSLPLAGDDGHFGADAVEQALEASERADAVVLGPGMGRARGVFAVAQSLAKAIRKPLLIDADGLNAIADAGIETLAGRDAPTVLTPHAGELGRLLGRESSQVESHRLAAVREAAGRAGATVVLKGDDTLVAAHDSDAVGVSAGGSPGLATAGTGDVLSGVIAALLARGLGAFEGACAGVRAHAGAGRVAAENRGADSVIAGDVVEALPAALRRMA
ncbi:MAG: NAD(P)H-hydrate dehydratase [Solirubrobacterales bacterium]